MIEKKAYQTPVLVVHGDVEQLTQGNGNIQFGGNGRGNNGCGNGNSGPRKDCAKKLPSIFS